MRILVVDDDDQILKMLVTYLRKHDWNVDHADTAAAARKKMAETSYDILLLDQQLPDGKGLEIAKDVVDSNKDCGVVLMTAFASVKSAVDAIRTGLADYLVKPFPSLEFVHTSLCRVAEMLSLKRRNRDLFLDLQQQKEQLEALVVRDPLTGLFNHGFLYEALERELSRGKRHDFGVSLVEINVDRFELLNREYGHVAGDKLLKRLADMFAGNGRDADTSFQLRKGDLAARYEGDAFILVLPHTEKRGAASKAEALRAAIARQSFEDIGVEHVTVSAGVASFPDDAADVSDLVHAAGVAVQAAKTSGRNRVCAFSPSLDVSNKKSLLSTEAVELRSALDVSIETAAFNYHFQPIVHSNNGGIYGYEALVRPTHPAIKNPFVLFNTAEETGRIIELGRVVRRGALKHIADLTFPLSLFVNLHPFELSDPTLLEIDEAVDQQRARIVFEITESSAISSFDRVNLRINELRERGYRIAIDDLGSGYAGLLALSRLTPDFVKLDRELVQRAQKDDRTRRLVRHVVDFANGEGIAVVAEGIETEEEREMLEEIGCGFLQGYLLGRPAPSFLS